MFCTKCGATIENENAKFCPKCGEPLKAENEEGKTTEHVNAAEADAETANMEQTQKVSGNGGKKKKPRKTFKKVIAILIVLVVAAIAAAAGLKVHQMKEAKNIPEKAAAEKTASKKVKAEKAVSETEDSETEEQKETTDKKIEDTNEADDADTDEKTDSDELVPGSNMNDAVLLPLGTKVFSEIEGGGHLWFAFVTGNDKNATYYATIVNTTAGSSSIYAVLLDEYGTEFDYDRAEKNGAPVTLTSQELEPNTTYYVRLDFENQRQKTGCSVVVKNPEDKSTAYRTVGSISQTGGTANAMDENGQVVPGTNESNAVMLPLNSKAVCTSDESTYSWFAFTTGEDKFAKYNVTVVNETVDSQGIYTNLYNEYGESLATGTAYKDGTPVTLTSDGLKPNTTYYVCMDVTADHQTMNYSIVVKSPEEKKAEKSLVFEVPFEINETQVQFVKNEAEFIDKDKAIETVKPVAEAINNAPGHTILIAGTTATDGPQESSVELSLRRAEAVKELLVNTYNVSEAQIKVTGLGYEADPFERGQDIDANGNFVESEAKKNRRVVILDAEDPIAQQLLSK